MIERAPGWTVIVIGCVGCFTAPEAPHDASVDHAATVASDVVGAFDVTTRVDVTASGDVPASVDVASEASAVTPDAAAPGCAAGSQRCGDQCVDTRSSTAHCGSCGRACVAAPNSTASCVDGTCRSACGPQHADCDADPSNGCETDLRAATNCGACGVRCAEPTPVCDASSGPPRCASGCIGAAALRCAQQCVDPTRSPDHCGRCDRECPTPPNARAVCLNGECAFECDRTAHRCGDQCVANDAVDTCGTRCEPCPTASQARATCEGGACGLQCLSGWSDCDQSLTNGCEVESRSSVANCGACGNACRPGPNGRAACANGRCSLVCDQGFSNCDGDLTNGCEANLSADATCGHCAWSCEANATCLGGVCAPCSALTLAEGGYAEVADDPPLRLGDVSFTVEAWLFATAYSNRCQHAIVTRRGAGPATGWFFSVTGSGCDVPARRLFFQVSGGIDPHAIARVDAPVGRWFHAAATYRREGRELTLWQDGAEVGRATLPPPSASAGAPLYIGNDSAGEAYTWRGQIDDVHLSTAVRYASSFMPARFATRDSNTLALWRFQSPAAIDVDASARGYVAFMRGARPSADPMYCRR